MENADTDARHARRRVAVSATAAVAGIALSVAMGEAAWSGWFTVAAVVALIWNLHRYGRTGPA